MTTTEQRNIIFDASVGADERLAALTALVASGEPSNKRKVDPKQVNNHIHTTYSFSPYTPSAAVLSAYEAGLATCGIMDHDSVGGIREFLEAGKIIGIPVTGGFECRVSVKGTVLEGKRLNNPDQKSCAYVAMHGIPHSMLDECDAVLAPLRAKRNERNIKMCAAINSLMSEGGISIDFEADVLPISMYSRGGSVTERHVLFALAEKIIAAYPDRAAACDLIEKVSGEPLSAKTRDKLLSAPDSFYKYDVLGVLKSGLISKIYIEADEELMHISEFAKLAEKVGAISAYAYLGDVGESVTGDKKAQTFEDSFLDQLIGELKKLGFMAITYMPTRNTRAQLDRLMKLCRENGFFEISGEDINSPRQSFVCAALEDDAFSHLRLATYALIGHELSASESTDRSMFSAKSKAKTPALSDRIAEYARAAGYTL